jgi:hypothetical protein
MLLKCQNCGAQASLDVMLGGDDNSKAIMAALDLSPIGKQVGKYLCLFRPAKSKLSPDRFAKLLGQLSPMIAAQQIERNGTTVNAPLEIWASAIEKVLAMRDLGKLRLPLESHGYLFEVILGEIVRHDADRQARGEIKKQEEKQFAQKRLDDARKLVEERDEAPKRRENVVMPDNVKQRFDEILSRNKRETEFLTPAQLEQRKQDQLAQLEHLMTQQEKAKRDAIRAELNH